MFRYLLKRLMIAVVVLFGISVIVFAIVHLQPGNPYASMLDPDTPPDVREEVMRKLGYYDPLPLQYVKWLGRALTGDFGYSIQLGSKVSFLIGQRIGNTVFLALVAAVIAIALAVPFGFYAAIRQGKVSDTVLTVVNFGIVSIPGFFFAMILLKVFSIDLRLLPSSGIVTAGAGYVGGQAILDILRHMIMPAIVLMLGEFVSYNRYIRSSAGNLLSAGFVAPLFAKGLNRRKVIFSHIFKNAAKPIITILCLQIPSVLSGAVITETIFSWPGIGLLSYNAAISRDYPLLMGIVMMLALVTLLGNLLADVLYTIVDPRIRLSGKA
ncbi:ABC transporter permease [Bifidobacterium avesanii]|uniref:ABC transporter permease subunit n=1 Tax=Bifidobacterium avesanii TaxID=1798157 RepID=A0A7K3TFP3_9BIFI|nr:ABC transporter permease [Bifidobacterium avesanii]KAB8295504.1 binding-protein-dependent transport systems inner membrane component [Bifidobacterium avesanii]NEG77509.1 ABC transporter permease subunit [Bifidobacterium avesanii]